MSYFIFHFQVSFPITEESQSRNKGRSLELGTGAEAIEEGVLLADLLSCFLIRCRATLPRSVTVPRGLKPPVSIIS